MSLLLLHHTLRLLCAATTSIRITGTNPSRERHASLFRPPPDLLPCLVSSPPLHLRPLPQILHLPKPHQRRQHRRQTYNNHRLDQSACEIIPVFVFVLVVCVPASSIASV